MATKKHVQKSKGKIFCSSTKNYFTFFLLCLQGFGELIVFDLFTIGQMSKKKALAYHFDVDVNSVSIDVEEGYDDTFIFVKDGTKFTYRVLIDEEADRIVREYIREHVWSFSPDMLVKYMKHGVSKQFIEAVQERCSEDCNAPLSMLIDDWDTFIEDAIQLDGRGHFLSSYDFSEEEFDGYYFYLIDNNKIE